MTTRALDATIRDLLAAASPTTGQVLTAHTADSGPVAMTEGQRQLWFLDRLAPGSTAYHVSWAHRLDGPLDVPALRRALTGVLNRHRALRTTLASDTRGRPIGVLHPPVRSVDLEVVDGDPEDVLRRMVDTPFDLADGPLVRCALVRVGDAEHVLIMVFHHAVIDAWSLRIVLRDLGALYSGRTGPPEHGFQYPDYAQWCQENPERGAQALRYWTTALDPLPPGSTVPPDLPRRAVAARPGHTVDFVLPTEVANRLHEAAAACGASSFTVALTAFGVLVGRLAGTTDVLVGVPTAGRSMPELLDVVGYFVTLLPLRVDLRGEPTFREVVGRVGLAVAEALDNDSVSFDSIVKRVGAKREAGGSPLVQVLFQLLDGRGLDLPDDTWAGLRVTEWTSPAATDARFDVELSLRDSGADVRGSLSYDRGLYRQATMTDFLRSYSDAVVELARHLDHPIGGLRP